MKQSMAQSAPLKEIESEKGELQQIRKNSNTEAKTWRVFSKYLLIALLLVVILAFVIVQQSLNSHQNRHIQSDRVINHQQKSELASINGKENNQNNQISLSGFRRIVWVQTNHELEAKHMAEAVAAQNLIHFGKQDGFQVRIVNNLNAYNWLPDEMISFIKDTHQKSKVQLPVEELLRLALLYEHGGVSIRLPNVLLMGGLDWIEKLLQGSNLSKANKKTLSCQLQGPQVVMLHEDKKDDSFWYRDDFIAAKPKAQLFNTLLNEISKIVKNGVWPYSKYNITTLDEYINVVSFPKITETLINIFQQQYPNYCKQHGLESFHENDGEFMASVPDNLASSTIRFNERTFEDVYGKKNLLSLNMQSIQDDIISAIITGDLTFGGGNSLLKNKLMMIEGNRWLATLKNQNREVQICIVSLTPSHGDSYEQQIKEQMNHLAKQTFTKWNIVNFIKDLPSVSQKINEQVILVKASEYEGLNLQRAATKYCDPASVMFLLDNDETLATERDLEILANHFKPIDVFAAFINIQTLQRLNSPSYASYKSNVQRISNKPNNEVLSDIKNLMRAFTVQSYRFVAHMDLRHSLTGRYFDREIPLMSMLEMSGDFSPCKNKKFIYHVKRLETFMDIPRQKVFTNIIINSNRFKSLELSRFEYHAKLRHFRLCEAIDMYQFYNAAMEWMVVLNDGSEDQALTARKGLPELIPRKIHQIWIHGTIPAFKQFLMKRLRDSHPDYEYFLWSKDNFTRENFPQCYDLLQTLLEFDNTSPFNKMAMIADIARYEIVYRHGGFYFDTNYLVFNNNTLDQFLTYTFMDAAQISPRQRILRDNGVFGAAKNHPHLARLVSHRTLSNMNHFEWLAIKETGPNYFGRVQRGQEQLDKTIFQQSFEQFYPNFHYDHESHNHNKCQTPSTTPDSQVLFRSQKRSYLKNCSEIYYYAYGMDFGAEGESWYHRRW